ncbi:DsbA family protein [Caulobacter mirabilis]|uniref:Disulfide bond formation protein DsbA n=1 Tax=Caulobacter mirabilis TaxID=69666 RepID=A0A2D2AUP9_9CAUL|nr:DsbA family protein [Caulobacter mirabilis]ATQ41728.1 disulfide bond formation protein DsbA [Caulobacter mirabilis]
MRIDRRTILAGSAILGLGASSLLLSACGKGGGQTVTSDDMSQGKADAPVTVVEYASLSCGHCAKWNKEVFPTFKAKYIDTGKVRYVFREFITPPAELATAGALLARCAGKDKYFGVVDAVFHGHEEIAQTGDIRGVLLRVAQSAGMNEDQFVACVSDEKALTDMTARVEKYGKEANVDSTPTFFFNDDKYAQGEMTMAQIDAAYDKALAKAKK